MALAALSAHEALLHSAASLQGLHPSAGWGRRYGFLRSTAALALLGFASLGRSPSRPLGLHGLVALPRRRAQQDPATRPGAFRHQATTSRLAILSGTSGTSPYWVLLPVLQSFKELGSWLTSPEVAGPLRFLSSSQAEAWVSDTGC